MIWVPRTAQARQRDSNDPHGVTTDGTNLYVADSGNHTIRKVVIATGVVTTLAGTAGFSGSSDGTGTTARFNDPNGVTTDGTNLYVADSGNHTIRKVVIATGVVTTLAGTAGSSGSSDNTGTSARFTIQMAITTDGTNLYVADSGNHTIRKVVIAIGDGDHLGRNRRLFGFRGRHRHVGEIQRSLWHHDGRNKPLRGGFRQSHDP